MSKTATIVEVAAQARVSTATVSRVMNKSALVNDATAQRVRDAAKKLGYHPNASAKRLREQQTFSIGLVVSEFGNPFFPTATSAVVSAAQQSGYKILIIAGERPEDEVAQLVGSRSIDGVLLMHTPVHRADTATLNTVPVPIVAFDRSPDSLNVPLVQTENAAGAGTVVRHLLNIGRTRIAHIAGPAALNVSTERCEGYREALEASGAGVDPSLIARGNFTEASGAEALRRLLDRPDPPDAVFAANDLMGIGALSAAKDLGIAVPSDLAIAGFDGIEVARYVSPQLTTYRQPVEQIANTCVRILVELLQDPAPPRRRVVTVPGELEIRGSTVAEGGAQ